MIFFESITSDSESIDALGVLVAQMRLAGFEAAIASDSLSGASSRYQQYDIAPLLTEARPDKGDRLVLLGAHKLDDAGLVALRRRYVGQAPPCLAVGKFETIQSEIGAKAKLSYVLGENPETLSTAQVPQGGPASDVPVIGMLGKRPNRTTRKEPAVVVLDPDIEDPRLKLLGASRHFSIVILTSGKQKQDWIARNGNSVAIYHYGEVLPAHISSLADVFVTFRGASPNYRIQTVIANLVTAGAALIDCSEALTHASSNRFFIRGARDVAGLQSHLMDEIIPNLDGIRAAVRKEAQPTVADYIQTAARLAGQDRPVPAVAESSRPRAVPGRALFVPTNGVGLGHAQRTSLIASKLDHNLSTPVFAAFPSCIRLINSYGFDAIPLVSRSRHHRDAHANDIVNYLRLHALSRDVSSLVFDGGYVFDSIYRTIFEHGLNAVWVRRGMWQQGQNNSVPLDREKVFGRVVVPNEAFEELNQVYSTGSHVREVGPIVQQMELGQADHDRVRAGLSERFGKRFDKLVVTMLGGGVAAKRSAQIQAICGIMDARDDVLHLVVVWPTATVEPGIFAWKNTRVVKTHHASVIATASDLYISAVGYNSFHEVLYNGIPTIFMPQMSAFMDDQTARARAATDRGLAGMVLPHQLMSLRQEISAFLDGGKSDETRERLAKLPLPTPGNQAAASVIEEMTV